MQGLTQHDQRVRYCPMLGHDVPFSYCRSPASELPCRKVLDCWWQMFDVEHFVREHLGDAAIEHIASTRPDRACTLVDLIRKAQQRGQ